MEKAEKAVVQISERINELQRSISQHSWRNASRTVFVNALGKSVSDIRELEKLFSETFEHINKDPSEGKPDLKPFIKEMKKLLDVLEKNLKFEKQRKDRPKTVNELEQEEIPDLYADLEQRVLGTLLKARYSLERLTIFLRKQGLTPVTERTSTKQVMRILEKKEDEIQELREKYEDVRKKSYLG